MAKPGDNLMYAPTPVILSAARSAGDKADPRKCGTFDDGGTASDRPVGRAAEGVPDSRGACPKSASEVVDADAIIAQIEGEIPRLRRFARAMVRDAALADDLVQECLERALSRLHLWRPGTNLRAWLFTILRNLHINGIRRRQVVVDIDGEAQAGVGSSSGAQIVRLELRDLQRALALLPTEQREVVLLIGLEGISYGEAADILGISIGTVKSRLSRGRRALRLLMEGFRPGEHDLSANCESA